jgi:predicted N-formylglutamate amidohydrolase
MKVENTYIIHTKNEEQANALKAFVKALKMNFEVAKDEPYDPEFVKKIKTSKKEYQEGKFTTVDKDNLESFLGL